MNRYQLYSRRWLARDMQSKYLRLRSMNIPTLKSILLEIPVEDSQRFLPALIGLEWISGQRPLPVLDRRFKKNPPVHKVKTRLHGPSMFEFYDNLVSVFIPSLKRNDLLGKDPIFNTPEKLFLDNILQTTDADTISFSIENIHYLLPLEREFQHFTMANADEMVLNVEIELKNRLKPKHLEAGADE